MLPLLGLLALSLGQGGNPSIDGTWTGKFEIHLPGGHVEKAVAWVWLHREDGRLTGAIGPAPENLKPIRKGQIDGGSVRFEAGLRGDVFMTVDLKRAGDHLVGSGHAGSGSDAIEIDTDLTAAPQTHPLYEQVAALDRKLFDAFNGRDFATVQSCFSKSLEFYHDKDGVTNYAQNMDSFKKHFASSEHVRRELVDGTMEVSPIKGFGAVETGVHRFYITAPGGKEELGATAKFVHVWHLTNGRWQITRVVSYDHE